MVGFIFSKFIYLKVDLWKGFEWFLISKQHLMVHGSISRLWPRFFVIRSILLFVSRSKISRYIYPPIKRVRGICTRPGRDHLAAQVDKAVTVLRINRQCKHILVRGLQAYMTAMTTYGIQAWHCPPLFLNCTVHCTIT